MCVRLVDDRFVLRFTFLLAVRLGLPRPASQVIHRSEPYTRSRSCRKTAGFHDRSPATALVSRNTSRVVVSKQSRYRAERYPIVGPHHEAPADSLPSPVRPDRSTRRFRRRRALREFLGNDPSAGSPTDTLLRLLLPLNGRARRSFQTTLQIPEGISTDARSEGLARSFNR